ncbi:DUF6268 family outer membrane beta-barrel protein [Desulfonema magnum]|uniref:DUF6268 domain-containing protein n=1 Tax=Desulfonema magnum TaxID=45655 RepID=A0A975BMT4_9BACT|nr:DUF6268 family outer membrane beta-barrel protein [Desulfonema magnum]QTA88325.1 Uncharacterized protein dnm_043680 [Desulfonema magnum]
MKHLFFSKKMYCIFWATMWMISLPLMTKAAEPGSPVLSITGERTSGAEIDDADSAGKAEKTCSGVSLTLPVHFDTQARLELKFRADQISYDWDDAEKIVFSNGREPWDKLRSADMRLKYIHNYTRYWSALAGFNLGAAWEDETRDSYSYGGYLAAVCRTDFNLSYFIGAGVIRKPEDVIYIPVLGMRWNSMAENGSGWSVSLGMPRTEIRYSFNEILAVYCNAKMDMKTYRLKDENKVSPSGLLEIKGFTGGLFADIHLMKPLRLSLGMTYLFGREWEIQDKDGETIQDVDIEDALGASVGLSWIF